MALLFDKVVIEAHLCTINEMTQVQAPAYVTLGKSLNMPDLVSLSTKNGNNSTCHFTVLTCNWNDILLVKGCCKAS